MKSLRTRLLVAMTGSFALLLAVFGLILDASFEYMLVREFDFYLETLAKTLAAAARIDADGLTLKLVPEAIPDVAAVEGELFSQYWNAEGTVLAKSTNLGAHELPRRLAEARGPHVETFELWDGRRARAARFEFFVGPAAPVPAGTSAAASRITLVVARDTTDLESHVREFRWLLLGAGSATMILGATVLVLVIRRSLRPLGDMAARIGALREDDLGARIPTAALPDEIAPLVQRLNELLGRLEEAFARERSLTADVAHELRTPVAGILSTAGVMLSADRTPADYREALEDVRRIARRMGSMIENLLMLARLDSQRARFQLETVALRRVVATCWQSCQGKAAARGVTFENAVPDNLCCVSGRSGLTIVLANLLENAAEYANDNGRIWVTARATDGMIEIAVANTGCRLSEAQVARVFDRFWRADASRSNASLHVGLGLALVRRIVASLGGTVQAHAAGGEFTVRIRLARHD